MAAKQQTSAQQRESYPPLQCSFAMCRTGATLRVRTTTGWATVCEEHDIEMKTREAKEFLKAEGIDRQPGESVRDWMTRTLEHMRARKRPGRGIARLDGTSLIPEIRVVAMPAEPGHIGEFAPWDEAPAAERELVD